jgi:lysophospholipase L1-like esterase
VGLCALRAIAQPAPYSLNLPQSFAPLKAKLASGQAADIVMIGDSLTFRTDGAGPEFSRMLRAQFGDAGEGWQPMSIWTGAELVGSAQPYLQGRINGDISPFQGLDGFWMATSLPLPVGGCLRFTPHNNSGKILYVAGPSAFDAADPFGLGSQVTARLPDGKSVRLTAQGLEPEVGEATFSFTSDTVSQSRAIDFFPRNTTPLTILGVNNSKGDVPGVRLHRIANGGWGVANYIRRDANFELALAKLTPDLVLVWLGQNDGYFDRATYATALRQVIARVRSAKPGVPVVLVGTYDSGSSLLPRLVRAMADVAEQDGHGFLNLFRCAGPYEYFVSRGFLADAVHHNEAGGRHIAELLLRTILADGANLAEPEWCTSRDFNHDGQINLSDVEDIQNICVRSSPCSTGNCDSGDFNRDGVRNAADVAAFTEFFLGASCPVRSCDSLDFNFDGSIDPADVDAYFSVLGESPCPTPNCDDLDFNNDGSIDPTDVDSYFSVLGEGPCL